MVDKQWYMVESPKHRTRVVMQGKQAVGKYVRPLIEEHVDGKLYADGKLSYDRRTREQKIKNDRERMAIWLENDLTSNPELFSVDIYAVDVRGV